MVLDPVCQGEKETLSEATREAKKEHRTQLQEQRLLCLTPLWVYLVQPLHPALETPSFSAYFMFKVSFQEHQLEDTHARCPEQERELRP